MKYSVIIPHKNRQQTIQRCIDSIPDREDIEVIIIDDNSDPNLVDFDNYPGKTRRNVLFYRTYEGRGAGYARNVGLAKSTGAWILFADSDDFYSRDCFDELDKLTNQEDVDIVYFDIFCDTTPVSGRVNMVNGRYSKYMITKDDRFVKYGCWAPWNKAIRRDFVVMNKLEFEEVAVGNDAMFSLRASKCCLECVISMKKLYCLTESRDSITCAKRDFNRTLLYLNVNMKINKFYLDNGLDFLCFPLLKIKQIIRVATDFGIMNAYVFVRKIVREFGLCNAIKIGVCLS